MSPVKQISYIEHAAIDVAKWDGCIRSAANGLVYAYSTYLNAMAPGWDALIYGDYQAVFPLPRRRKFGISYIFQPTLVGQLGLFGNDVSAPLLHAVLNAIPGKFAYVDLPLNASNNFYGDRRLYTRMNYVLPLDKEYDELFSGFNQNVKRNIIKAVRTDCYVQKEIEPELVISLAETTIPDKKGLRNFLQLYKELKEKNEAISYGVRSKEGELLAGAIFLFSNNRAYYVLAGTRENGKRTGASHYLIDQFIRENASSGMLLDFEGSDVPGVAQFYSSFGATEEPYTAIRWNRLPRLVRWLKK